MKITVISQKQTNTFEAAKGSQLLDALRGAGLAPDAVCGGEGKCGKCQVRVDGVPELACRYTVEKDILVEMPEKAAPEIMADGLKLETDVHPWNKGYMLAFDIGTTTVLCYLLSPEGKELAAESRLNPQGAYGADVITRIRQALAGNMAAMTALIRNEMTSMLTECCKRVTIRPEEIGTVSVVGNPCMQQLFMGISPENLSKVPFAPVLKKGYVTEAAPYLPVCTQADLLVVPDISGYVGADTVAGILATKMYQGSKTTLLVDIGTNGEMVLAHKGRLFACSAAAGPALEGASIHFGMRGAKGAVDHVWQDTEKICCSVIGGGRASGICGSGLIDAVCVLKESGRINRRGRIQTKEEKDGQRYVPLCDGVYLTQEDIRQVQMAKGAICAGIVLMLKEAGIPASDVEQVFLAGAFGTFMNPVSACRIGLLPEELADRTLAVGNVAGSGAKMLAVDQERMRVAQELVQRTKFLELAELPDFQRVFASCMML